MCDDSVNVFPPYNSFKEVFILKVVYPVCCGVDVHKSFFIATIITTTSDIQPNYSRKRFSTFNNDIMKSSEKNRFQNAFTVCNIGLDSVVSDMFGKSATLITDYLLSGDTFNPEYCVSLLQRSLKKKADSVLESIEG